MPAPTHILLIMGVAGAGKTTIGRRVAMAMHWPYFEGDDFHSAANKDKMARGFPLDDADRAPWLAAIRARMDECRAAGRSAVFTCSTLKAHYRAILLGGTTDTTLVYLSADFETIHARVSRRKGHYMKAALVRSQFEALEPPADAFTIDASLPVGQTVLAIVAKLQATLADAS